jgi:hypothetical protein
VWGEGRTTRGKNNKSRAHRGGGIMHGANAGAFIMQTVYASVSPIYRRRHVCQRTGREPRSRDPAPPLPALLAPADRLEPSRHPPAPRGANPTSELASLKPSRALESRCTYSRVLLQGPSLAYSSVSLRLSPAF